MISEDIFPNAVDYFQGPEEDDDLDEDDIELGSDEDSDGNKKTLLKLYKNTNFNHSFI